MSRQSKTLPAFAVYSKELGHKYQFLKYIWCSAASDSNVLPLADATTK
jgi:hypothetical protein